MKILIFADLHMCPRASIINKWGMKYPSRLENCIASVNWLEKLAKDRNCDYIVSLGDFFDKPDLTSETITACNEIKWSKIPHYSLVGNHDASTSSLVFNSVNSLLKNKHKIITDPFVLELENCDICFLPYIVECDRKPISEYFKKLDGNGKYRVILSHNDLKGIQLGPILTKSGFTVEEIEDSCDIFINGHLHNGQVLSSKVINLGNLTGKDFGENAFNHSHCIAILDTDTLAVEYIENPYAYNFYKLQIDTVDDLLKLNNLKNNAVVSIKCDSALLDKAKQLIENLDNIIESRLIVVKKFDEVANCDSIDLSVDHLAKFIDCCKASIESSSLLEEELNEICK